MGVVTINKIIKLSVNKKILNITTKNILGIVDSGIIREIISVTCAVISKYRKKQHCTNLVSNKSESFDEVRRLHKIA